MTTSSKRRDRSRTLPRRTSRTNRPGSDDCAGSLGPETVAVDRRARPSSRWQRRFPVGPQHAPDDGNVHHTSANGSLVSLALPSSRRMKERRRWIGQLTMAGLLMEANGAGQLW